jgi:hypothetical protein
METREKLEVFLAMGIPSFPRRGKLIEWKRLERIREHDCPWYVFPRRGKLIEWKPSERVRKAETKISFLEGGN